jgi:hypothetical protein
MGVRDRPERTKMETGSAYRLARGWMGGWGGVQVDGLAIVWHQTDAGRLGSIDRAVASSVN